MMLWYRDAEGHIMPHRYNNSNEIMEEFIRKRYELYHIRYKYILRKLNYERTILLNKCKFIKEVNSGKIEVKNTKKSTLVDILTKEGYYSDQHLDRPLELDILGNPDFNIYDTKEKDFEYLLDMKIQILTEEKKVKLFAQAEEKQKEYNILKKKTLAELWIEDLNNIKKILITDKYPCK